MGNDFPPSILFLICALLLTSCTQLSFQGNGYIPLYLTPRPDHNVYTEASGIKEYYLWGIIGPDNTIDVDKVLYEQGLVSAANITMHDYQSTSNFFKALLSFGFYIPKNYKITARGIAGGGK